MAVRTPLIGLAVVVVGGIAGLVFLMSGGDDDGARAAGAPPATADAGASERAPVEPFPPAESPQRTAEVSDEADEPREPPQLETASEPSGEGAADAPSYREHHRPDGTLVRDHRADAEDREPLAGGISDPRRLPETAEKVSSQTVLALRGALRPSVRQCGRQHAPEAELGSAISARVTFSVASGRLTVDDVSTQSRRLDDPRALLDCVESAAGEITLAVAGAEDVEGHPVDLPFRVGPAR